MKLPVLNCSAFAVAGGMKHAGGAHAEVVDGFSGHMSEGLDALAAWLAEESRRSKTALYAISGRSHAEVLSRKLVELGVPRKAVHILNSPEYFTACSGYETGLRDGSVTHSADEGANQSILDRSVAVCDKKLRGTAGSWSWEVTVPGGDETPLEAVSVAVWAALTTKRRPGRKSRAVIRTAASGQRLQLDSGGLKTYNTSGTVTSTLGAWDGQLTLSAPSATDRMQLTPSALWLHDADGIRATLGKSAMQLNSADGVRSSQVALDRLLITRDEPRPTIGNVRHEAAATVAADSVTIRATLDPDSAGVRQADATMSAFYESGVPRAQLSADYLSIAEISALNNVADPGPKNLALKAPGATLSLSAATIALSGTVTGLPAATESALGVVERATQAEADAGVDTTRYLSAKNVRDRSYAPWAMAAGTISKRDVIPSGAQSITVTFPPGRFAQPPVVTSSVWGVARDMQTGVDSVTATSCTVWIGSNSTVTRNVGAMWQAVQMTETSASG